MGSQDDKAFVSKFSWILVGLVIFTFVIAYLAGEVDTKPQPENPAAIAAANERIAPVAGVYAGEAGQAAADKVIAETRPVGVAAADELSGEEVYNLVCAACHVAGVAGAPIPGSEAWEERLSAGMESLIANAINGIGAMPPKGGRTDLSDEAIAAAVEFMNTQ